MRISSTVFDFVTCFGNRRSGPYIILCQRRRRQHATANVGVRKVLSCGAGGTESRRPQGTVAKDTTPTGEVYSLQEFCKLAGRRWCWGEQKIRRWEEGKRCKWWEREKRLMTFAFLSGFPPIRQLSYSDSWDTIFLSRLFLVLEI